MLTEWNKKREREAGNPVFCLSFFENYYELVDQSSADFNRTHINPDDDTSAAYPEPVIQLAGSRLVDGAVTYSSNGDGTINVYNVPLRWDGEYPAGEEFYSEIIENTELVEIEPGSDEEVIRLIELLEIEQ